MAVTSRISPKSNDIIEEISKATGKSKIEIIEAALEAYRHHVRMCLLNESFRRLRADSDSWKEENEDRKILEGTLEDGFEEE